MAEERRSAPRARISGVRVIFESAGGDPVETGALNIGRGGLFVTAPQPPAVGKRIALEIQVTGEATPWSALGRVVWTRGRDAGQGRPPGMGVKLIDVEDSVLATIDGLVDGCEEIDQREIEPMTATTREATLLGVGTSTIETAAAKPIVLAAPGRENTGVGVSVGSAPSTPLPLAPRNPVPPRTPSFHEPNGNREPSVVIDLVTRDGVAAYDGPSASDEPTVIRRRGMGRWVLASVFLAIAAAAAYAFLNGDVDRVVRLWEPPPSPPPSPKQPVTATTSANATTPATTTATTTPTTAQSATALPVLAPLPPFGSASTGEPRKAPSASPANTPSRALAPAATASKKAMREDNPY
ncbi:MAG: PilZ domain-containing protein [Myxococcota bacterium]|nr:PilZ domain-containing protein [Myxococcota bacterium]